MLAPQRDALPAALRVSQAQPLRASVQASHWGAAPDGLRQDSPAQPSWRYPRTAIPHAACSASFSRRKLRLVPRTESPPTSLPLRRSGAYGASCKNAVPKPVSSPSAGSSPGHRLRNCSTTSRTAEQRAARPGDVPVSSMICCSRTNPPADRLHANHPLRSVTTHAGPTASYGSRRHSRYSGLPPTAAVERPPLPSRVPGLRKLHP